MKGLPGFLVEVPTGGTKIAATKEQSVVPNVRIFVPASEAEGANSRNVVLGGESFYSPAEL